MEGNVVRSVGFKIYKEIKSIKTDKEMEIVSIKSKIPLGKGTIMMATIAITKNTTLKSRWPRIRLRLLLNCCLKGICFANGYSSRRSEIVTVSRKLSILPCNLFKNGHNEQERA